MTYNNSFAIRLIILLVAAAVGFGIGNAAEDSPNGSTDGRYHTCGYVTEVGVTEHLAAYADRCG